MNSNKVFVQINANAKRQFTHQISLKKQICKKKFHSLFYPTIWMNK